MRQFASTGLRIWNLSLEAKLVYSAFGLMSLLALLVSALFYEDLVGHSSEGVRGYYAGEVAGPIGTATPPSAPPASPPRGAPGAPADSSSGGPRIELPDEPGASDSAPPSRLTIAVTYRKLLEVTHFHLFTVPVFLLIIAHLFMLTGLSSRAKVGWIASGWIAGFGHLAAPWLVRYGGAGWAWSYAASGALLGVSTTVMTLYPMWSMWLGKPPERAAAQ